MFWLNVEPARTRAPDFVEHEGDWTFSVDAPGAKREDVAVVVAGGSLTVSAKRETTAQGRVLHAERRRWTYERSWALPEGVTEDAVQATLQDGVLTVTVAKPASRVPRRVEVQVH